MTNYRADFPIFSTHPKLVYLDSAATTQKPERVIEAVSEFYRTSNANVHRGLYELSEQATESYEAVRQRVMEFIGANSVREVIFTNGATEAINLLASSLTATLQAGDEIILSKLEHHANLVPWQEAAKLHGLVLKFAEITEKGEISLTHFTSLLSPHTKLVAISHCSNVFGRINPIATIKKIITEEGSEALLLIDAAQTIPHLSLSVQDLGADFIVFSGHKLYAPSGTGVLWGREALLATLPPYQTGGDMIKTVSETTSTWNDLPWKFEAGTPNIEGVIGLGAAISYLRHTIGMASVQSHTDDLSTYAREQLSHLKEVSILGDPSPASGIISFTVAGIHPHDLASLLSEQGICIRAGHHCAAPLHAALGITASNRISFGIYNTRADIDVFITELQTIVSLFNHA